MTRIMTANEVSSVCSPATAVANTNLPAGQEKLHWRTSQRGNPFTLVDGFNVVVFRRQTGQWSVRIEELETGQDWYPEGRYLDQAEAKACAFQALRRIASEPRAGQAVRVRP
jgi:hypothetical protein